MRTLILGVTISLILNLLGMISPGGLAHAALATSAYTPRGTGGGGAMGGYSISPYSQLRFVGTDMGTLFRSEDGGKHWEPVHQLQTRFDSDLNQAATLGFSADGKTVFHASGGRQPQRSQDAGLHWSQTPLKLRESDGERLKYWASDSAHPGVIFAATSRGLYRTTDLGGSWKQIPGISGESKGTFVTDQGATVFHATPVAIYVSRDSGASFSVYHKPESTLIRSFAGGTDTRGQTLAYIDTNGAQACGWAISMESVDTSQEQRAQNVADCGYVWIQKGADSKFQNSKKDAGSAIRMAENDSSTIYVTGGNWIRQYGSKVWISRDTGATWDLRFQIYNWDVVPYAPWSKDHLEHSATGLDVGWDDDAYTTFSINPRNSAEVGGTGYYFLHTTTDYGDHWKAPFTEYADEGERARGKRWRSTGLEVTSVLKLKFHPRNPKVGYATVADIGGLVTEDGGDTWRISKVQWNTNYDYAFDPENDQVVYAVSGHVHDFPMGGWGNVMINSGGVYRSENRGRTWTQISPVFKEWTRQYLSIGYDPIHKYLYAGTQGAGIGRTIDGGHTWEWLKFPKGLEKVEAIIPQIEIDPDNGNVYCLLSGDAPKFSNQAATGIYFMDVAHGSKTWELLRNNIVKPEGVGSDWKMWWYPTGFAVDWTRPARDTLWLIDMEHAAADPGKTWLDSGVWKTTNHGATWERKTQFTQGISITLDPTDGNRVYAAGGWDATGGWGAGGALYSTDGGSTWKKNDAIPLVENLYGVRPDPNHPENVFYLFFGGGMLYGPRPE